MRALPEEFDPDPLLRKLQIHPTCMHRSWQQHPGAQCWTPTQRFTLCRLNAQANGGNGSTSPVRITTCHCDKHPYWQDKDLPVATKNLERLRSDMLNWGYCKIDSALSPDQVAVIRQRVLEQAEGERMAGIAQKTPSGQNINCCINMGGVLKG